MRRAGFFRDSLDQAWSRGNRLIYAGAYDAISSQVAASYYDGAYLGAEDLCASLYGMRDHGFISWRDMVDAAERICPILAAGHLMVDLGVDPEETHLAAQVSRRMAAIGVSAGVFQDYKRADRGGEKVDCAPLTACLDTIEQIRESAPSLSLLIKTGERDPEALRMRVRAYSDAGVDAIVLADADLIACVKDAPGVALKPLFAMSRNIGPNRGETGLIVSRSMLHRAHVAMHEDSDIKESSMALFEGVLETNSRVQKPGLAAVTGLKPADDVTSPGMNRSHS